MKKNYIKQMFALLLVTLGSSIAYAQTVTFTAGVDVSSDEGTGAQSLTKDGVTLDLTGGMLNGQPNENGDAQYRIYKGQTLTISAAQNIEKVEFNCTASGEEKYGPGCFEANTGSYSYDGYGGTWTGAVMSVKFTAKTNQVRATTIVVTLGTGTNPGGDDNGGEQPSGELKGISLSQFTNGDFETWTDGLPVNWKSTTTASNADLEQSTSAHGGNYAVLVKNETQGNKRLGYTEMILEEGTYHVSFFAKAEEETAYVKGGYAPWNAEGGKLGSYVYYPEEYVELNSNDWTEVSFDFTLNEKTQLNLVVMNHGTKDAPAHNILIDDFAIEKKDGGETPQPVDLPVAGNIQRLKTMESGQEVKLMLEDALVLYVSGKEMFVRDASSAMCFYGMSDYFKVGDVLNGSITAKYTVYKGMPELTAQGSSNFSVEDATVTTNNTPQPTTMTLDEIAAYECDYVVVNNMTIEKQDDGTIIGYTDDAEAVIYDKFKLKFTYEEGNAYNVTGIVVPYQANNESEVIYQFCPTEEFSGIQKETANFVKATSVEAGKRYLLVAEVENEDGSKTLKMATPVSGNYGYLYVNDLEPKATLTNIETENALTIEADATTAYYRIKQSDGRYYWMDESHNSFQVETAPNEGFYWDIQANGDGTFTITNVDRQKYIQFSITHNSYGSYPEAQDNAVMPMLYVEGDSDATAINEVAVENQNAAIYNMAGQRINNAVKGVYIQNGKKFIVK